MSRMLRWPNKEADTRKISFRVVFNLKQAKAAVCFSSRGESHRRLWHQCDVVAAVVSWGKRKEEAVPPRSWLEADEKRGERRKEKATAICYSPAVRPNSKQTRRCVLLCCVDSGTPSGLCFTGVAPSPSFAHQTSVLKTVHVGVSLQLAGLLRDRDLTRPEVLRWARRGSGPDWKWVETRKDSNWWLWGEEEWERAPLPSSSSRYWLHNTCRTYCGPVCRLMRRSTGGRSTGGSLLSGYFHELNLVKVQQVTCIWNRWAVGG